VAALASAAGAVLAIFVQHGLRRFLPRIGVWVWLVALALAWLSSYVL
jgi:hypothetical protein